MSKTTTIRQESTEKKINRIKIKIINGGKSNLLLLICKHVNMKIVVKWPKKYSTDRHRITSITIQVSCGFLHSRDLKQSLPNSYLFIHYLCTESSMIRCYVNSSVHADSSVSRSQTKRMSKGYFLKRWMEAKGSKIHKEQ